MLRDINSIASMTRCSFTKVDINWVLDIGSFTSPHTMLLKSTATGDRTCADLSSAALCKPVPATKNTKLAIPTAGHRANPLGTCGFSFPGQVVLRQVEKTLDSILYNNGIESVTHKDGEASSAIDPGAMKIFRIKGVLHTVDDPEHLHLFQGVHDIFDLHASSIRTKSSDDTTGGMNKVIVIGKNLDMLLIEEKFIDCIAD